MLTSTARRLALLVTSALALGFTTAASAQDYDQDSHYRSGTEEVIVTAPRYHGQRSEIGAPIEDVSMSRDVRFDDLDLRTPYGAHVLRERVRFTAQTLCRRLDQLHPISTADSPPCLRTALDDAMAQADEAIREARGE